MPYSGGQRLTATERASKLGHLEVVRSPFVKSLVDQFEFPSAPSEEVNHSLWHEFNSTGVEPLSTVLGVDGSMQVVSSDQHPKRALAFVKTAIVRLDRRKLNKINKDMPHPVQMKALMTESALQHSTVLPLRHIRVPDISNYDLVRNIIRDSLLIQEQGLAHETLKWLAYRKWVPEAETPSPEFQCPHCSEDTEGLRYDADSGSCQNCGGEVFLSDMIGFHLEMGEDQAPDSVASAYMLVHETLLLFSIVRHFWARGDYRSLRNILLIKDGPLSLRGQYSKLVPNIRHFLQYSKDQHCDVHIIGQEKSGRFVDYLADIQRFTEPKTPHDPPRYAVLSHRFIRQQVDHAPERVNPYGLKTNYGEKILVKLDPYTSIVLSVPTGAYCEALDFPSDIHDLIGFDRILGQVPNVL